MARVTFGRKAMLALFATALALPTNGTAGPPPPNGVPVPAMYYNGPGFATVWNGRLISVARQGTRHWDDPSGRIALYDFADGKMQWPPEVLRDTHLDDRNAAGGVTPSGALVYFYSRLTEKTQWEDMWVQRIGADGEVSNWQIPTGGDAAYSAYGPLVVLPSGALMQTLYGWGKGYYRVRAIYSFDDGYQWHWSREIWRTSTAMPNETAAAYVDGRADHTSRLIAVSRSARRINGHWRGSIMQSISTDGGMTWRQAGIIGHETQRGVIPWITNIGRGRLALLTAVRDHDDLSINVSIAPASKVFSNPRAWPAPRTIYRSRLMDTERIKAAGVEQSKNFGDFGYQSIVRLGPSDKDLYVILMDSHNGHSGVKPGDYPSNTELVMIPLFG